MSLLLHEHIHHKAIKKSSFWSCLLFSEKEKSYFLSVLTYPWLLRSSEQLRALAGWLDCESLPLHIVFKTDYVSLFSGRGRSFFFMCLKKNLVCMLVLICCLQFYGMWKHLFLILLQLVCSKRVIRKRLPPATSNALLTLTFIEGLYPEVFLTNCWRTKKSWVKNVVYITSALKKIIKGKSITHNTKA